MGKIKNSQISEFRLEGRFLGFVVEDGYKIKQMQVATAEGECEIKLAKELRAALSRQVLTPGVWVQVTGEKKLKPETGEVKLKGYTVAIAGPNPTPTVISPTEEPTKPQACILVCQKSDCCKRGAMQVCQALAAELRDRGLEDQVTIKGTGCMKQCKAGPHIVIVPDKTAYRRLDASEIPDIIEKHFVPVANEQEPIPQPALVS